MLRIIKRPNFGLLIESSEIIQTWFVTRLDQASGNFFPFPTELRYMPCFAAPGQF